MKLVEQLYEQTRFELNKEKQERTAENHQLIELRSLMVKTKGGWFDPSIDVLGQSRS